jgi:hypothetical protein
MPKVVPPPYLDAENRNGNRRQDAEDRFFLELIGSPREFNGNGVEIVAPGILANSRVRLNHGLGFKANGWLLKRVQRALGVVVGPRLPFYRADFVNNKNTLELFIQDAGDYTFLVF